MTTRYTDSLTGETYNPYTLQIRVCKSAAGFYIGQEEPSGCPFSRLSEYYFRSEKEARSSLVEGFSPRIAMETSSLLRGLLDKGKLVVLSAPQGSVVRSAGLLVRLAR